MNSLFLVILALAGYLLAYRLYGRFLGKKLFRLSSDRLMPAHEFKDGVDYVPSNFLAVYLWGPYTILPPW